MTGSGDLARACFDLSFGLDHVARKVDAMTQTKRSFAFYCSGHGFGVSQEVPLCMSCTVVQEWDALD